MADVDNSYSDGNVPNVITKAAATVDTSAHVASREIKPHTHVEAAMQLRGLIGDKWNSDHFADLQKQYPQGVPHSAITEIADRIVMGKPVTYLKAVNE